MDEFSGQHTFRTCVFLVVVSEMRNYTHFTYFSIHIFFYIVTSQFKDLAITLLSSCVSMSSTPKNFRDLSISLRNILYHRRVQHTVSDPIPDQFCIFADNWSRFWSWCLVEILKMKFDQDLYKNLQYELNPRVRCAFGNVWAYKGKCEKMPIH